MRENRFAWRLVASVNAKNSYGGYTGARDWWFFFRGDVLVAIGEPQTSVGSYGTSEYMIIVEASG